MSVVTHDQLKHDINLPPRAVDEARIRCLADPTSSTYGLLAQAVRDRLSRTATAATSKNLRKTIHIPYTCSPEDERVVGEAFKHFDFAFDNTVYGGSHSRSAVILYAAMEVAQRRINYRDGMILVTSRIASVVQSAYKDTHVCCDFSDPVLQARFRASTDVAHAFVRNRILSGLKLFDVQRDFVRDEASLYCKHPHACTHKAPSAVVDLSETFMPLEQMFAFMMQHQVEQAIVFLPFSPEMITATKGRIEELDAEFRVVGNKLTIYFGNDVMRTFSVPRDQYLRYVTANHVSVGGNHAKVEMVMHGAGLYFMMLDYSQKFAVPRLQTVLRHNVWLDHLKDKVMVETYDRSHPAATVYKKASWVVRKILVPKIMYEKLLAYAEQMDAKSLDYASLFRRASAENTTTLINNKFVRKPVMLDLDDLSALVTAVYFEAYTKRYQDSKVMKALISSYRVMAADSQGGAAIKLLIELVRVATGVNLVQSVIRKIVRFIKARYPMHSLGIIPEVVYISHVQSATDVIKSGFMPASTAFDHFRINFAGGKTVKNFSRKTVEREQRAERVLEDDLLDAMSASIVDGQDDRFQEISSVLMPDAKSRTLQRVVDSAVQRPFFTVGKCPDGVRPYIFTTQGKKTASWSPDNVTVIPEALDVRVKGQYMTVAEFQFIESHWRGLQYFSISAPKDASTVWLSEDKTKLFARVMDENDGVVATRTLHTEELVPLEDFSVPYRKGDPEYIKNFVQVIQDVVDHLQPDAAIRDVMLDPARVNEQEMAINADIAKMKVDLTRGRVSNSKSYYQSRIRSSQTPEKQSTLPELMISLTQRNLNVPNDGVPQDEKQVAVEMWRKFLGVCCRSDAVDMLTKFKKDVVCVEENSLREALAALDEAKARSAMQSDSLATDQVEVDHYQVMVKNKVKAKPTAKAATEYAAAQTVVYNDQAVNVAFTSVFRQLRDRLLALLKPNVAINMKKSVKELDEFFSAGYVVPGAIYYENDFKSYDKSQGSACLELEMLVYRELGMDMRLSEIWQESHALGVISNRELGFLIEIETQKRSGELTTALGNTIVNMLAVNMFYDFSEANCQAALGDDHIAITRTPIKTDDVASQMAAVLNLHGTPEVHSHGYFCSRFIVPLPGTAEVRTLYDPILAAIKLGRPVTCVGAVDAKLFAERFEAYREDVAASYDDVNLYPILCGYVAQRYGLPESVRTKLFDLLLALRSVGKDVDTYRSLWERVPTVIS